MKKLTLIRHASTEENGKNIHQTKTTNLSKEGIKEVKELTKNFINFNFDAIITSPYKRALQTVNIINENVKLPVIISDSIIEVKKPSELEGLHYNSPHSIRIKELLKREKNNPYFRYSDEETYFDLIKRSDLFIQEINDLQFNNILAVTHNGFMKVLLARVLMGKYLDFESYKHIYESVLGHYNLAYSNFDISENSFWRLLYWNNTLKNIL